MIRTLGRTVVLVHDYEDAVAFYEGKLGFEVLVDTTLSNGFRALHLGLPTQPGVGVWLMRAETDEQRSRVGNQTGGAPLAVVYTDDCRKTAEELARRGVVLQGKPEASEGAVHAHFEDLYGNVLILVELAAA